MHTHRGRRLKAAACDVATQQTQGQGPGSGSVWPSMMWPPAAGPSPRPRAASTAWTVGRPLPARYAATVAAVVLALLVVTPSGAQDDGGLPPGPLHEDWVTQDVCQYGELPGETRPTHGRHARQAWSALRVLWGGLFQRPTAAPVQHEHAAGHHRRKGGV